MSTLAPTTLYYVPQFLAVKVDGGALFGESSQCSTIALTIRMLTSGLEDSPLPSTGLACIVCDFAGEISSPLLLLLLLLYGTAVRQRRFWPLWWTASLGDGVGGGTTRRGDIGRFVGGRASRHRGRASFVSLAAAPRLAYVRATALVSRTFIAIVSRRPLSSR